MIIDGQQLIHGDCLEVMKTFEDKIFDLIIVDPPYNIGKAEWDKISNYVEWCGKWMIECQRVLKDNGSFYFFHNDMPQIAQLMEWIRINTRFVFKQFIVWNKKFNGARNEGFLRGFNEVEKLRNYQQMAEYLLFYTFQDETGLTTVKLDMNNFPSLRRYFKDFQNALGLTKKQILDIIGQQADHCFRWGSSQWDMPTKETYTQLEKLPLKYEFVRQEYESLRQEYESLRYTFNNQKTHHSVWDYDVSKSNEHITPKPLELIKNIIEYSSNENDLILDPFAGSFTTGVACNKLNRKFIGIEKELEYYNIGCERMKANRNLFLEAK